MKSQAAIALLVAGLLAAALPAGAQDQATAPLLEDSSGDAQLTVQGTPVGSANQAYPAVDLIDLKLAELPEAFVWTLQVNDLRAPNEETGADGVRYDIGFEHNGRFFQLMAVISLPMLSGQPYAYLNSRDSPDGQWSGVWFSPDAAVADLTADTITVTLPRETLADLDGAVPFPGRSLSGIHTEARSTLSGGSVNIVQTIGFPYDVVDAMPNARDAWALYPVQVGVQQSGNARLGSLQPFRASNGEATTFVYQVQATNIGEEDSTYELAVVGNPMAQVVLPIDVLTIESGESVEVPVLATVPFAHQHGGLDTFLLEMRDLNDAASIGRIEMGIRYLTVPQPAGHHDTVFLHLPPTQAGATPLSFTEGFLNTLETDDRAGTQPWHATGLSGGGLTWSSGWNLKLSPGLEMGLDVDADRLGQAIIPISATVPMLAASLEGYVYVAGGTSFGYYGDGGALFSFTSAPVDIQPGQTHSFDLEVKPGDIDTVPFEPGQNLYLDLRLTYTMTPPAAIGLANESPALEKGGFMRLPLNEYHDDVDEALAILDGPTLTALGPQQRLVNPGEAVVFNVAIDNPTNESLPIRLGLTGLNAAWGAVDDDAFTLPAESTANITVVVRAPADAFDGDRADLILQAYPKDQPMLRSLLRLVTDVDTEADHPDDAPLAGDIGTPEKKDTPAPSLALVGLALVALALARRRR